MKKFTAEQIADWFLTRIDREAGDTLTHLKLQKLVYYAQAMHLAVFGEKLFEDEIQAWKRGPVIPILYYKYEAVCAECEIPMEVFPLNPAELEPDQEALLTEVLEIYGEHSAKFLENLTHTEKPWLEARGDLPGYAISQNVINTDTMKLFYKQKLNGE